MGGWTADSGGALDAEQCSGKGDKGRLMHGDGEGQGQLQASVVPFSSCLLSVPASGSFQMSQLFTSGGQRIGVSASTSVLPMNTQD